ncbi:MAG: DUF177 domain-containing protein [Deltaproteobacteria bacterium]|nr:DUF177 domain-containing protein [Deltaproteobacteria bacterium]
MRPVIVQLREIREQAKKLDYFIDSEFLEARLSDVLDSTKQSSCSGTIKVEKIQGGAYVTGQVKSEIFLKCNKCLSGFNYNIPEHFSFVLLRSPDHFKDETELKSGDLDVVYFSGEQIDLTDHIVDHLILEIPMNPVCSEDCTGIQYDSKIPPEFHTDPRWEGLRKIAGIDNSVTDNNS